MLKIPSLTESQQSVVMGMALLAATNAERSVYQNVEDGKQAWDEVVAMGLIVQEDGFWHLSDAGRRVVTYLQEQFVRDHWRKPS